MAYSVLQGIGFVAQGHLESLSRQEVGATWSTFNTFLNHYKVDPAVLTTVHFGCSVLDRSIH